MFWLQRPPYLRRAAAAAIVIAALAWDLRPAATQLHPFAATGIESGRPVEQTAVEWRPIPVGLLELPDLDGVVAAVPIAAGDPIVAGSTRPAVAAPEGWWEVAVTVGPHAAAGDRVLLVVADPPLSVEGLVVSPQRGDRFSLDHIPAVVAVPPERAGLIAAAAAENRVVAAVTR